MGRKGLTVRKGSLPFLLIAAFASLAAGSPVRAVEPVTTAQASQLADGTWTVQGTRIPGSRRCQEWLVRITNAQGHLSGRVSHAGATVPLQNLVLMPDESFSGTTPADFRRSRHAHPSSVTGKFSEDTLSLTFKTDVCPPRQATATRRAAGG